MFPGLGCDGNGNPLSHASASATRGAFPMNCIAALAPHSVNSMQFTSNVRFCNAFINSALHTIFPPSHLRRNCNRVHSGVRPRSVTFVYAQQPLRNRRLSSKLSPTMGPQPEARPGRHWITRSYGDINNLKLEDISIPPPGPKEIRVSVRAVGMNFADCFAVLGLYDEAGPAPLTPGFEVSGIVESIGSEVTRYSVGDRVWALKRFGAYATMVNIDAVYARPLKDDWSFAEGAAFPAQAFTAWYALCVLGAMPPSAEGRPRHVTSRRRAVLVHSAAGGVGLQLVEMIRHIGGLAVCTVGNEKKAELLHDRCGVPRERVIVRGIDDKTDDFETVVRERALGGEGGLDVVVDSVLGDYFAPGYELLNPGGRYIVMGSASIMPKGGINLLRLSGWRNLIQLGWNVLNRPKLDLLMTIGKNKTVCGFNVLGIFSEVDFLRSGFDELEQMDLPKPLVGKKFAFDNTRDALEFFQSGKSVGKIVLEVNESTM